MVYVFRNSQSKWWIEERKCIGCNNLWKLKQPVLSSTYVMLTLTLYSHMLFDMTNFNNPWQRMKELEADEDTKKMLRLSIEAGGCSGFQYKFSLDDKTNSDDRLSQLIIVPH